MQSYAITSKVYLVKTMKTNITNYEQVRSELTTPCTAVRAINSYTTKFAVVQTAWRTQSFVVQNQTRPVSAKPYCIYVFLVFQNQKLDMPNGRSFKHYQISTFKIAKIPCQNTVLQEQWLLNWIHTFSEYIYIRCFHYPNPLENTLNLPFVHVSAKVITNDSLHQKKAIHGVGPLINKSILA